MLYSEGIQMVYLIMTLVFAICRAGVIRPQTEINACTMCSTETAGHLFCRAGEMMSSAILSVEACPGVELWTDGDMIVTGLRGWVDRVTPTRTTLTCDRPIFQRTTEAILNGEKCLPTGTQNKGTDSTGPVTGMTTLTTTAKLSTGTQIIGTDLKAGTTTTTTTAKPFPWWPVPFPEPEAENQTNKTTASTTTTTITSGTTSREMSTEMIAVIAGLSVSGYLLIFTLALTISAVGVIISVRCVRRR